VSLVKRIACPTAQANPFLGVVRAYVLLKGGSGEEMEMRGICDMAAEQPEQWMTRVTGRNMLWECMIYQEVDGEVCGKVWLSAL
jgi:hypothetical protein